MQGDSRRIDRDVAAPAGAGRDRADRAIGHVELVGEHFHLTGGSGAADRAVGHRFNTRLGAENDPTCIDRHGAGGPVAERIGRDGGVGRGHRQRFSGLDVDITGSAGGAV